MQNALLNSLPPDAVKLALALLLSLLIGLQREEQKLEAGHYRFGGARTFPLIGLLGYALALVGGDNLVLVAAGLVVVGGLMLLSYRYKLSTDGSNAGITTEISALGTYVVGALVAHDHIWVSCALAVFSLLLLDLKGALEGLARKIAPDEIATLAKFLLLTVVLLPIVPDQDFTQFHLNPFRTWLAVVAVSGVSYGSYVLERLTRGRGGPLLSAMLGGAYSSTVTTVVLARRAASEHRPHLFSGSIVAASGVMYARLIVLLALFSVPLAARLGGSFALLALAGTLGGAWWSRRPDAAGTARAEPPSGRNPLQLRTALLFGVLFMGLIVITQLVMQHLGRGGTYALAAVMGVTDVDPFVLGLTQTVGGATPLDVAAASIVIAAASNNLVKGVYAWSLARRKTGAYSFAGLGLLAAAGLLPLFWI
ncbi:MAG: MgtC/SapB family protein [Gemmatimonadaceae bacterium]|nr:MgtC/SapB family protein [Gemmatimonadaceae bacterium]